MHAAQISSLLAAIAAFAGLGALLLNLLLFHNYPLFTAEAGISLLVLFGLALTYGALYGLSNRWMRTLLEGVLIAILLDAGGAPAPWPIALGMVVLAFVAWRHRSVLPFVMVAALCAALSSAMGIGQHYEQAIQEISRPMNPTTSATGLPAVVHIILDEHVGLDGLPLENPRTPEIRAAIENFYLGNGFRLYSRAHSDYAYTLNSIPQILNFGQVQEPSSSKEMKQTVEKTAYFDLLARRGYRVKVYQSEFLNMCGSPSVTQCLTYQSQDLGAVAATSLSTGSKVSIILRKLTSRSLRKVAGFAYNGLRKLGLPLPFRDIADIRLNPLNAALAFDHFNADLERARPGEVYFAHILLPHSPFGLAADCRIKEGAWIRRERPGPLNPRQNAGYDQMLCALEKTKAALRAVGRSPAGSNFVMIVHGDHGSRTTNAKPFVDQADIMTDSEKLSNFSTLFAVRAPGITGKKDASPLSLPTLLTSLARSKFTTIAHGGRDGASRVFLDDENHVPRVKIVLPQGW